LAFPNTLFYQTDDKAFHLYDTYIQQAPAYDASITFILT